MHNMERWNQKTLPITNPFAKWLSVTKTVLSTSVPATAAHPMRIPCLLMFHFLPISFFTDANVLFIPFLGELNKMGEELFSFSDKEDLLLLSFG